MTSVSIVQSVYSITGLHLNTSSFNNSSLSGLNCTVSFLAFFRKITNKIIFYIYALRNFGMVCMCIYIFFFFLQDMHIRIKRAIILLTQLCCFLKIHHRDEVEYRKKKQFDNFNFTQDRFPLR